MDEFGTMADFDELLQKTHAKDIRLLMDLLVNHTSDQHPWFVQSRASKNNSYHDFYIWRPGKADQPPNNWCSSFGGSAWEKDEETNEYYLHLFSTKQPELNWENKNVRHEIYDLMRFWLDKGVDGFRMDVINYISKTPTLPNGPHVCSQIYGNFAPYCINEPHIHDKEMLSH